MLHNITIGNDTFVSPEDYSTYLLDRAMAMIKLSSLPVAKQMKH